MADGPLPRAFPFRRDTQIDPYWPEVTAPGAPLVPMAIQRQLHQDRGVTTFEWTNTLDCWVQLRGWNGAVGNAPQINEKGHMLGPGAQIQKGTQSPDWVAVVALDTPEKPIFNSDGTFKFTGRKTQLVYGGGGS